MAKSIKRVVMIFFVLVISCLLIVGCIFASNLIQNNSLDAEDSMQSTADKSYTLTGTESQVAATWNEAVTYSKNNSGVNVNVTLGTDWTSTSGFGTGAGFSEGRIWIPQGTTMGLDINKHVINRNLYYSSGNGYENGEAILVNGTLNLKDSSYTKFAAKSYLEKYGAETGTMYGIIGLITGGCSNQGVGAIRVSHGTFNMYGGLIFRNKAVASDATWGTFAGALVPEGMGTNLNLYGGAIAYNTVSGQEKDDLGALLIADYPIVNLYDILITKNIGGGVGAYGSHQLYVGSGVEIYENTKDGEECNVDRNSVNAMKVIGDLSADGGSGIDDARIGVTENTSYPVFTDSGYSKYNAGVNPARYFFDDNRGYKTAVTNSSGEVLFSTKTYITKPTQGSSSVYSKTYTGSALTYTPNGFDSTKMTISGNIETDANSYTAIVEPKEGYVWSGTGQYERIFFSWEITPKLLTKPTQGASFVKTYTGKVLTYTPQNFDTNTMDITGNVAINAGNYTATVSLKNSKNYKWADGKTTSISLDWKINPEAIAKPSIKNGSFEYDGNEKTLVLRDFDSNLMTIENNTAIDVNRIIPK